MNEQAIVNCQLASWYKDFEHVTYRTRLIELPDAFVDYLLQDGVFLPEQSAALPVRSKPGKYDDYQDWADDDMEPQDAEEAASKLPAFPELFQQIESAIAELGRRVLPKLNWSAPMDAVWLTTCKSIACTNADEVVLLLKGSDRVAHDLCHAFDACAARRERPARVWLALRKFHDLRPGREFRCFMHNHELIAVSQRNIAEHYPQLAAQREELLEALLEFAEEHLERFPEPDFAADVYVAASGRVWLVDFNPIGGTTSPLLFDWEELPYSRAAPAADTIAEAPAARQAPHTAPGGAIDDLLRELQLETR
ncbi:hypothetical protein WJX81_006472 [Elliptochloris bilobata]|uniref:Cell division cycle protein 123 n=1 Tax=Elliptochloris bilobata TaxID=381761 RepID=A0AAW1RUG6_9CHLO